MPKKPTKQTRLTYGVKTTLTPAEINQLETYPKAKVVSLQAIVEQSKKQPA